MAFSLKGEVAECDSLEAFDGEKLRFYVEYRDSDLGEDVYGFSEVAASYFCDGTLTIRLMDHLSNVDASRYYQRNQSLRLEDLSEGSRTAMDKIELLCCNLDENKLNKEVDEASSIVINCREEVFSIDDADLEKEIVRAIAKGIDAVFRMHNTEVVDDGAWVAGDRTESMKVSLKELLNDQGVFNGKRVKLEGYLLYGGKEALLYVERKAQGTRPGGFAPFVEITDPSKLGLGDVALGDFIKVSLEGVFYQGFRDSKTQHAGRIERITHIEIFDR